MMTDLEKLKELHEKASAWREDEHAGDAGDAVRFEGFCYDTLPALIAELEAARAVAEAANELVAAYLDAEDTAVMGDDPLCTDRVALQIALTHYREVTK